MTERVEGDVFLLVLSPDSLFFLFVILGVTGGGRGG
jgi:hypothetical protein